MDSLTQIVLGASVGEAVLGKKVGNRAMLWGAIGGTIPDLDVFLKYFVDDITSTEMHRGFSHSLVFAILIAPVLGWIAKKIHKKFKGVTFKNWSWMFFWIVVTHPLLDAHTSWGTQFFWPFEYRLAYQNIFVVDPLYTVPFLILVAIAMFHKKENPRRNKFNKAALIVSSSYMLLTLVFKGVSHSAFHNELENQNIEYVELDTKPTPLNTILWNAFIETETGYRTAYFSLFDSQKIQFSDEFKKNHELLNPYIDQKVVQQLIKISAGWYFVEKEENSFLFWDIRFGQVGIDLNNSPFIWCYKLTPNENGQIGVERLRPDFKNMKGMLTTLFNRAKGN
ncbi:MAG: metal-dependent hydrolase [Crocinitomicaceae bacterium]|nr:metal-dependent hydrolase [Crocinitomicaceae bacterium]|tara:strand:- start:3172 stop:4182 length:1011 start_codon:yes stop_codon:yes gene_type:complete